MSAKRNEEASREMVTLISLTVSYSDKVYSGLSGSRVRLVVPVPEKGSFTVYETQIEPFGTLIEQHGQTGERWRAALELLLDAGLEEP